jgi:hypothetical protein
VGSQRIGADDLTVMISYGVAPGEDHLILPVTSWVNVRLWLPAQSANATHALNLSAGVSNSGVLRGRSLSCRATLFRSACECTDKSVPLGKYCRSNPFVFSFGGLN